MKNILLLGGYGFLGTNIIKHIDSCCQDEYQVIVFDRFENHPAGVSFSSVVCSYAGDFSDAALIGRIFTENKIDLVIHAISTTIPAGLQNARYDVESNLFPTLNLMECMVKNNVKDILYISSGGAIYGNNDNKAHKESDDVFPISSYGVVKLAIEKYLMQYAELYGLKPLILRLSNPYGPWHYSMKQGVCNVAMTKAVKHEEFTVWGDGDSCKDYIYVEDFVRILFLLLRKGISCDVINVGSRQLHSVNEIVKRIKALVPQFEYCFAEASKFDVSHFELETAKLHSLIGTYDFITLEEGLHKTLDWTLKHA